MPPLDTRGAPRRSTRTRLVRAAAGLAGAAVLGAGGAAALGAAESAAGEPAPPRLLVTAREWSLELSRAVIDPGDAIVQLWNRGEDSHDVWIRRLYGTRVYKSPETQPGDVSEFTARLRPGRRYKLWCSLPGHRELGMRARLRVNER
jgi:hypothetical protein